ncbi:hypothetical protein AeNC1_007510 [Aphanomyces euteiches]|nr:hypothetical protein AeNC1_007510 [Aphanomyces euteiches]
MDALRPLLAPLAKKDPIAGQEPKRLTKAASVASLHDLTEIRGEASRRKSISSDVSDGQQQDDAPTLSQTKHVLQTADGEPIPGVKYNQGAMTHLKFRSVQVPAARIHPKEKTIAAQMTTHEASSRRDIRCGFCHANNMLWHLKCTFCGCCRVSDVPRMHYITTMMLSVNPGISATQLAQELLQYAKFDGSAVDAEKRFKQATLVRCKAAMVLMTRTSERLRWQIMRLLFMAWKKVRAEERRGEETMARLIKIKEMQTQGRLKAQVFTNWKNLTTDKWDERFAKLSIAADRKMQLSKRFIWSQWIRFVLGRLRKKCDYWKDAMMSNQDLTTQPSSTTFDGSKQLVLELKDSLVTAVDQSIATSEALTAHLTRSMQAIQHVQKMLPNTAGYLVSASNLTSIVDGFLQGDMATLEASNLTKHDALFTQTAFDAIQDRVGRFVPWETLIQWLNMQLQYIQTRLGRKISAPLTTLQDIRSSLASPKLVLHLLWHLCPPAQDAFNALYADECANDPLLALSPNSATNRHVHWKLFLRTAKEFVFLPDDVATRDELMSGHFDAYYCILVHLFSMFPSVSEPLTVAWFPFLGTWPALKESLLVTNAFDDDVSLRDACRELLRRLRTLLESQTKLLGLHDQLHKVLAMHHQAVIRSTMGDLCCRLRGRESSVAIELEKEELAPHVRLEYARLAPICSIDQFNQLDHVLRDYAVPLVHIFRACSSTSSSTAANTKAMGEHDFYKLMSQCGIIERKHMNRAYLQIIVQASSVEKGGDRFGDVELSPTEFVEAVVRVAFHLHEKRPAVAFVDTVKELLDARLLPVAAAVERQSIGSFKRQLRQQDVQAVLRAHDKRLKRAFAFHASMKGGKFMSLGEFEGWLKEQRLIDTVFPHTKIKQLFQAVQQDAADSDADLELIFAEFVEAIAAVAVFRNPNPYIPLATRLETFLADNL